MQTFEQYIHDRKKNTLWHLAKKYAKPDHFMCFTEATWSTKNASKVPNGITAFPILETLHLWKETADGYKFSLFNKNQDRLYILEAYNLCEEYSEESYKDDISHLKTYYDFPVNQKLIESYRRAAQGKSKETQEHYQHAINKEQNKFDTIVAEATDMIEKPEEKIWEVTKWIAAGGKNPLMGFNGNASQRWTNILRKLGYSAFVMNEIALFLDIHAFEVIDECKK